MNVGKDRRHPQYVCDKCKQPIYYEHRKGIPVNKYFKQHNKSYVNYKDFDLCDDCEKKFREWLNTKELETTEEIINKFPIDLIEVGDFVNGSMVYEKGKAINGEKWVHTYGGHILYENEIKTILTHEQYEQNCYKVGDIDE